MKSKLLRLLFSGFILMAAFQNHVFSQARIVFGTTADAYMVMSSNAVTAGNPIYLVIGDATGNCATNTITRTTNGGIITNGENNLIKWYVGNGTGAYMIPYAYGTIASLASNYIPFTFNITSAGTANRYMNFSTYRTGWQNSAMKPTGVTNCNNATCNCDASLYMVDRFWQIDNSNYASVPTGDLSFNYVDGGAGTPEVFTAGNTFAEADLQAESYNGNSNLWAGVTYGTDNTATNNVSGTGNIAAPFLFRWWTLVDKNHPLPVTWLRQSAECNGGSISIKWSTSSEQNSDFFTVEKSVDGINFTDVTHVIAAGNSSTIRNYSAIDLEPYSGVSYYRIRETDFNSSSMVSELMTVTGCSNDDIFVYGSEGGISVNINAMEEGKYTIELYDMLGQKLTNEIKSVGLGENHMKLTVPNIASAMYVAKVYNSSNAVTKKVFIRSAYTQ